MPSPVHDAPRRKAFTLIELLVVVSVIALLVGILLPVLGSAQEAGRTSVCLSNMRQMGIAATAYAYDNKDTVLPSVGFSHGGTDEGLNEQGSWFFQLQDYAQGDTTLMARCPSDDSPYWDQQLGSVFRRVSYATNYLITGKAGRYPLTQGWHRLDKYVRPSKLVWAVELVEENKPGGFAVADHVHPDDWIAPLTTLDETIADQVELDRHNDRCNYVYADGHAATLPRAEVFDYPAPPFGGASRDPNNWTHNHFYPDIAK
ncbi:MAG: prepilin-type N-terminal cleavage/methylation domain-containing protein [Planctomycetota bacterium]